MVDRPATWRGSRSISGARLHALLDACGRRPLDEVRVSYLDARYNNLQKGRSDPECGNPDIQRSSDGQEMADSGGFSAAERCRSTLDGIPPRPDGA